MAFTKPPRIKFEKINQFVSGVLEKTRTTKSQYKDLDGNNKEQNVYDIRIQNGDALILVDGKEVEVDVDTVVTVFGSKQIDQKMADKEPGDVVTITFKGKLQKKAAKGNKTYAENAYEVN